MSGLSGVSQLKVLHTYYQTANQIVTDVQIWRSSGVIGTKQSKVEHYVATCVTVAQGRVMQWKCIVRWLMFSTAKTHPVDLLRGISSSLGQQPTLYSAVRFWALCVPTDLQAQINTLPVGFLYNWRTTRAELSSMHISLSQCHKEQPYKYWEFRGLKCFWESDAGNVMLPPPSMSGYRLLKGLYCLHLQVSAVCVCVCVCVPNTTV